MVQGKPGVVVASLVFLLSQIDLMYMYLIEFTNQQIQQVPKMATYK